MIATVDTNVLVSGLFFGGIPGEVVTCAREGMFTLAMTAELLAELREVISRPKFGLHPEAVQLLMRDIEGYVAIVNPRKRHQVVERDADDDAVVDCAVVSGSKYIVSGDTHLTDLEAVEGIEVVTPKRFVDLLKLARKGSTGASN